MKAVNLIPGEQRQGAGGLSDLTGRSGGAALILLGVVVGLAVMIAMYGSAHHSISSQDGEVAQIKAETSVVEARTGRLTPYTDFVSMADQRTQTVAELVQARFDWSHVLRELGRVLPAGTSLSALHGSVGASTTGSSSSSAAAGSTPASSTPPGSTPVFTLTGCATSQTVVAQALQRLRLMDGASEVQLQSSTKAETGASGGSGGSAAAGSCAGTDPSFTTQVTFVGLPVAPATGASSTGAATAAVHSAGAAVPVSAGGPSK
ncbi:MAG TPA: hypothetical protein VIJ50_02770 [Solirubrobacteraceae bacterium]